MYKVSGTAIHSYSSRYSFQGTSRKSYFLCTGDQNASDTDMSADKSPTRIKLEHYCQLSIDHEVAEKTLKDTTQYMALVVSHLI